MGKSRSKGKSGSIKSQTIVILTVIIGVFIILIFRPGIIASILNPLMFVILIISVLVNAFLIYKLLNKDEKPISSTTIKHTKPFKDPDDNDVKSLKRLSKEKDLLMVKVLERDSTINQLNAKITDLKGTLDTFQIKQKLTDTESKTISKPQAVPVELESAFVKVHEPIPGKPSGPKITSLFFDGPYDDRVFSETNAASEKRHRYVYRIEYATAEPSIGKLHLEPSIEEYDLLRSYSDTVLKPACTFDNAFYTSFHNISQLAPGTVQKQGNDWFVKEKVKIRFN